MKMNVINYYCILIFILGTVTKTNGCYGCLDLDEFNFYKIIPKFEAVLIKFDIPLAYDEKHDAFTQLARELVHYDNIVLGLVRIKDYDDEDNKEFAMNYGVNSRDDLPALKLFVQGKDEPFCFDKNLHWNNENLKKFIHNHTNIYLALRGCLESFDKLAVQLTNSNNKDKVLERAETEAKKLANQKEKNIARTYIKYMKKVMESDRSFVTNEINRLEKIIKESKLKKKKRVELSHNLNILKSFVNKVDRSEL